MSILYMDKKKNSSNFDNLQHMTMFIYNPFVRHHFVMQLDDNISELLLLTLHKTCVMIFPMFY